MASDDAEMLRTMGESSRMCELTNRHLQSVVSLKVRWKDWRQPVISSATGSIVHASTKFIFILTCAHTFRDFIVCDGPGFDSADMLGDNTTLQVEFFDGYVAWGEVDCIDWWKDLCLVVVPFPVKSSYAPVEFIDDEEDMMGQSVYSRGAKLYSIYCFPTNQKEGNLLFGTAVNGEICGRNNLIGNDLDPVYHSDLRFFEYYMAGADGCSGAPLFGDDFRVIGMWIARAADLKFALKFGEIRQWAYDWFDITDTGSRKTMKEIVANATDCISKEIKFIDFDLLSKEYNIDDFDL